MGFATRERAFPGENAPRPMDLAVASLTIPKAPSDDRMGRRYNAPGDRSVQLRPDPHGTDLRVIRSCRGAATGEAGCTGTAGWTGRDADSVILRLSNPRRSGDARGSPQPILPQFRFPSAP
ncbi:hypothetical protein HNR00_001893 [Methylorubrum rhodinum]|uniref:Uncharacterized protein n=1 Tax=Methylorubrum rhodinum TaxID=29428 RepID=A0A840ZGQ0_9HYPH|nr:hypothetical protein [Methylorubrum rhodinum]MBB5757182.1 hypothetical protein [Methylorubrum rhodinum]